MKYIITNLDEVIVGNGYHQGLAEKVKGKVVAAGECEQLEDGWTVFGRSYGFGIRAKNSDRDLLNKYEPLRPMEI